MGSLTRQSYLERVLKEFEKPLNDAAEAFVGKRIVSIGETSVEHRIQNDIKLDTEEEHTAIWRWSSEEEQKESQELPEEDEGEWYFADYLKKWAIQQKIKSARVGLADRDDEIVLFLTLENDEVLEIDTGIFAEQDNFWGWSAEVLSEEAIKAYFEKEWNR